MSVEPIPLGTRVEVEGIQDWQDPIVSSLANFHLGRYWVSLRVFEDKNAMSRTEYSARVERVRVRVNRTVFNERQMDVLRAVWRGDVPPNSLRPGGAYEHSNWNNAITEEEMFDLTQKMETT